MKTPRIPEQKEQGTWNQTKKVAFHQGEREREVHDFELSKQGSLEVTLAARKLMAITEIVLLHQNKKSIANPLVSKKASR